MTCVPTTHSWYRKERCLRESPGEEKNTSKNTKALKWLDSQTNCFMSRSLFSHLHHLNHRPSFEMDNGHMASWAMLWPRHQGKTFGRPGKKMSHPKIMQRYGNSCKIHPNSSNGMETPSKISSKTTFFLPVRRVHAFFSPSTNSFSWSIWKTKHMGTLPRSTKNLTQASNFAPRFPGAHLNIWAAKKQTQLKDSILMIDHFCLLLGGSFEGIRYVCPLQTKTVRNAKKSPSKPWF